ncbi:hypothetical protein ACNPKZ_20150 [Shewanella algae]|uniref:hypothetical protein n=1 Tax=Shewanella algae TaxID=38313 RepID=UPI001593A09E|nr:hypothetical protein [Shewanella algae]QXN27497.1 hypothetical protein KVP08_022675 [Shewanella putrefaciens]HDS1208410.1 hypothetical protein [Shewanella algae]
MDAAALLTWLNLQVAELTEKRDHAISFDNYGKAAVLDGEISGVKRVIGKIELGDFNH